MKFSPHDKYQPLIRCRCFYWFRLLSAYVISSWKYLYENTVPTPQTTQLPPLHHTDHDFNKLILYLFTQRVIAFEYILCFKFYICLFTKTKRMAYLQLSETYFGSIIHCEGHLNCHSPVYALNWTPIFDTKLQHSYNHARGNNKMDTNDLKSGSYHPPLVREYTLPLRLQEVCLPLGSFSL